MERKLFKKLFSMLLVLAMVLSMCPTFVFAEKTADPDYCPHCDDVVAWTEVAKDAWNAGGDVFTDGVHYRLTGKQTLSAELVLAEGKDVVIDLNGNSLSAEKATESTTITFRVFTNNGTMTIVDNSADKAGVIEGGYVYSKDTAKKDLHGGTLVNNGTFNMYAGTMQNGYVHYGNTAGDPVNALGGNVYNTGIFNMYGGKITNGTVRSFPYTSNTNGGNVYCTEGAKLNLYGGEIVGGNVTRNRWARDENPILGINVCSFGDVTIDGGKITGATYNGFTATTNNSQRFNYVYGGNLYIKGAKLVMSSGEIADGQINNNFKTLTTSSTKTVSYGGNIYALDAELEISGGSISGGVAAVDVTLTGATQSTINAEAYGGNIYLSGCTAVLSGGTIEDGSVTNADKTNKYGGNLYVLDSELTISGTTIRNGSAYCGGNFLANNTDVVIKNALISGGTSQSSGGSIYQSKGTLTIEAGAVITGGVSTYTGGNIYATGATVTMTGGEVTYGKANPTETAKSDRYGGNIDLAGSSTFNMSGGKLEYGFANYRGGNMAVRDDSVANISGTAEIKNGWLSNYSTSNEGDEIVVIGNNTVLNIYDGARIWKDVIREGYVYNAPIYMITNPTVNMYGGDVEYVYVSGTESNPKASFNFYGGHLGKLGITSDVTGVTTLYNGTIDSNPSAKAVLAACSCYKQVDGKYVYWHIAELCTDAANCPYQQAVAANKVAAKDQVESEHVWGEITVTTPATCTTDGAGTHTCTVCGITENVVVEKTGHSFDANGECTNEGCDVKCEHSFGEYAYNNDATCEKDGTKSATCAICGYKDTVSVADTKLDHEYDTETGICKNGCNELAAAKVTLDGNVSYYSSALDALVAANDTGANVCFLKTVTVTMKNTFKEANALKNVTLSTAPGVTFKDNSGTSSGAWYVEGITFAENSTFDVNGYLHFVGGSVNNIDGRVTSYMIGVNEDSTLNINGNKGGYLRNTGNLFLTQNGRNGAKLNIYGNGGTDPVLLANEDNALYAIANYTGQIYIENAVISIGAFAFRKDLNTSSSAKPGMTAVNSTIILRNLTGSAAVSPEDSLTISANSAGIVLDNSTIQMPGTMKIASDTVITLKNGATIITPTADLENAGIIVEENFDGCVWYEDGAYIVKAHNAYDATCTEDGKCTNCGAVITEATGHTLSKTDAVEDTCTAVGNSAYWTCSTCGKFFSDAEGIVEINENDWIIDEVIDHAYGEDNVCDNGCGKTKCENNGHSMTFHAAEPSNCTEEGTIAHYNCSVCGKNFADEAGEEELNSIVDAADGHSMIFHAAEPSSCTEDGTIAHYNCSVCGKNFADEAGEEELNSIVDAADGHSHASEYHPATETENAYTVYTCHCGDTYTIVEEGTMLHVAVNQTTNESYTDLQAALDAAAKGQTVKLLKDTEAEDLYVGADKKLDLNGKKLTITSTVAASFGNTHIIDSSNSEGAMILAEGAEVALNTKNEQLPIWTDEGVKFAKVGYAQIVRNVANDAEAKKYSFYFTMTAADTILDTILTQSNNSVTIRIKVNYTTANGMNAYQYFELTDDMEVQYGTTWAKAQVNLILRGAVGMQNLVFTAEIVSTAPNGDTVVIGSTPYSA